MEGQSLKMNKKKEIEKEKRKDLNRNSMKNNDKYGNKEREEIKKRGK